MWMVWNWCYAGLGMLALMCMIVVGGPSTADPERATIEVAVAGLWRRVSDGRLGRGHGRPVVPYRWRYLDADGTDVTERDLRDLGVVATAEAVQMGEREDDGPVLLRVQRHGDRWRIAVHGGLLGDQLGDRGAYTAMHDHPYAAMHEAARQLRMVAREL